MIIVITPEIYCANEIYLVNELLKSGIDLLHIRKFNLQDMEVMEYVDSIEAEYRNKLVLHSHRHLANILGINRVHIREADRKNGIHLKFKKNKILSTSTHSINEFNKLEPFWDYAFLSPLLPSISKPNYGISSTVLSQIKFRTNQEVKLIGLGGIKKGNVNKIIKEHIDGFALLGAIWNNPNPGEYLDFAKNINY